MPIMRALEFLSRSEVFLASGSPRRRELLQKMNPFRISYCAIPESVENLDPNSYALPEEYVLANVRNKLDYAYDDVPNRIADSKISKAIGSIPDLILTADTVVVDANEILEKPQSADDNFRMIRQLSGKTHAVITAVAFLILDRTKQDVLKTTDGPGESLRFSLSRSAGDPQLFPVVFDHVAAMYLPKSQQKDPGRST